MAPSVDVAIPTTSVSSTAKPYTIYNITVRLPLRSFTVQKRYSDFVALHQSLVEQTGVSPPTPLPQKSWFIRTISNPEFTEERRKGLEGYIQTINTSDDSRWRITSAWRTFLNLPISTSSANSSSATIGLHEALTSPAGGGAPISDPILWLDCYRDLKTYLQDARLHLQRRDQAQTALDQRESSAAAKRCLIKAGGMITALDQGLKNLATAESNTRRSDKLGEGELRRRKDLVGTARKEKEGLEILANSLAVTNTGSSMANGAAPASAQQKSALIGLSNGSHQPPGGRSGRVLGAPLPETEQTRELDNEGVLQLQKKLIENQDLSLEEMTKGIVRLKTLGIAINEELQVQHGMMKLLDEDVERCVYVYREGLILVKVLTDRSRVGTRIEGAKKRVGKIS